MSKSFTKILKQKIFTTFSNNFDKNEKLYIPFRNHRLVIRQCWIPKNKKWNENNCAEFSNCNHSWILLICRIKPLFIKWYKNKKSHILNVEELKYSNWSDLKSMNDYHMRDDCNWKVQFDDSWDGHCVGSKWFEKWNSLLPTYRIKCLKNDE